MLLLFFQPFKNSKIQFSAEITHFKEPGGIFPSEMMMLSQVP